jgi:putative transcriptional regulator
MKLNRIRAVLEDKGISQTWLAKKLGRSFSTVNAYVCNRTQPNLTTLLEIAQLLSVDMKELITDEKERNDNSAAIVCGYERAYHGRKGA